MLRRLQPRRRPRDDGRRRPGGPQPVRVGAVRPRVRRSARARRAAGPGPAGAGPPGRRPGREEALISHGLRRGGPDRRGAADLRLRQRRRRREHLLRHRPASSSRSNQILHAFWTNIWVACVSEVLVLIFGLLVAIVRMLPGRAGAPLRVIAVVYCDVFRAIPAIVVIFLIVFGLPLTGVHFFADHAHHLAGHLRADPDLHRVRLGGLPRRARRRSTPARARPRARWASATCRPCGRCWCRRRYAGSSRRC